MFFKIDFLKNSFRNTIRKSNSLDPDQARSFVGPDLGPNCLPRLSADDTGKAYLISSVLIFSLGKGQNNCNHGIICMFLSQNFSETDTVIIC